MPVDPRSAAEALEQIAAYLKVQRKSRYKPRAYSAAARAVRAIEVEDLTPILASGELAAVRGLGPATLAVIRDLVEHGHSLYLEQLRSTTPDELVENAFRRAGGAQRLYPEARAEGERLCAILVAQPGVARAAICGALRRHCETVGIVEMIVGCGTNPRAVAADLARMVGVRESTGSGSSIDLVFIDGVKLRVHCVPDRDFGFALFAGTGVAEHVAAVAARLIDRGFSLGATGLERLGESIPTPSEEVVYELAGLAFVDPALREFRGEIEVAARHALPRLVTEQDIRGVLHCHSTYSDGSATIEQLARAAQTRGWSYLGISDHSQAAVYAGGLSQSQVQAQHAEIDRLNASSGTGIRILKGIEADILSDGRLDYGPDTLDRFDFVIGAIHSRFAMGRDEMTARILRALDQPQLTILAHPTGRRLLSREPYSVDMDAILEVAAARGVAIELNADPRRLDLDWRYFSRARELGVRIAIGPDAHSVPGLDTIDIGVGMAKKGWLESDDVLNTRSVNDVLAFARARKAS